MAGMMGGGGAPNLKKLDLQDRVKAISHGNDTYRVTTADGKTRDVWERNLRFKTDTSDQGPEKGAPAIVGSGMQGDRASVVFPRQKSSANLSRIYVMGWNGKLRPHCSERDQSCLPLHGMP